MKNKSLAIVLSIVASCFVWLYVITFVNPVVTTTVSGIPVQILGTESLGGQGLTVDAVSHKSISVTITGNRSDSAQITAADILAMVDVTGQPSGENEVRVNVSAPSNVEIKEVKPNRISVRVDEYVTVEKELEINYKGTIPAGYEIGFFEINPAVVKISGAKNRVEKVETVRMDFDLANLTEAGYGFELPVTPLSDALTPVEYVTLSATKAKGKAFLCETKELPLVLVAEGEVPEGFEFLNERYKTIKVRAANVDLRDLTRIETLAVPVPQEGEKSQVTLVPLLPENVEPANGYESLNDTVYLNPIIQENEDENAAETDEGSESSTEGSEEDGIHETE